MTAEGVHDRPIEAVHVLSSGTGEQHPEHRFGTRAPQWWWVLTSRSWIKAPAHYFVLEHRDGLVLFDIGLDPAIASDPGYISSAIGRLLLQRTFRLLTGPEDALDRRMRSLGLSAGDVCLAVISHLHFDHVGGIVSIPQADLLVGQLEWAVLSQPHPEREWILREHIVIPGAQWRQVTFTPTDEPLLAPLGGCHVGDPVLASNLTRRTDFALFMVHALTDDRLIREAPAIVGCKSASARAHADAAVAGAAG